MDVIALHTLTQQPTGSTWLTSVGIPTSIQPTHTSILDMAPENFSCWTVLQFSLSQWMTPPFSSNERWSALTPALQQGCPSL